MQKSWLVQRLEAPRGYSNPFSFGGGMRNGGLSEEAMSLLGGIFSFDYMGSAEFEFGAIPETLRAMADQDGTLTAYSFDVPLVDVPRSFRDPSTVTPTGDATIYVICRHSDAAEVTKRIVSWTQKEFPPLKESLRLTTTLRPCSEYDGETQGWLELDNGFFFFTDRDMWEKTASLFGVEVKV